MGRCNIKIVALLLKEIIYRFNFSFIICSIGIPLLIAYAVSKINFIVVWKNTYQKQPFTLEEPVLIPSVCEIERRHHQKAKYSLAYEPSTPFSDKLAKHIACLMRYDLSDIRPGFEGKDYVFGVQFLGIEKNQSTPPESLEYLIYPGHVEEVRSYVNYYTYNLWKYSGVTGISVKYFAESLSTYSDKMSIQRAVDSAFLNSIGVARSIPQLSITMYPQKRIFNLSVKELNKFFLYLLSIFCFVHESCQFIKRLITEREKGVTEYLKIMGFSKKQQRMVSIIFLFIVFNITVMSVTKILESGLTALSYPRPQKVRWYIMYLFLFLPILSHVGFDYFYHFFFKNAVIGNIIYVIIYIASIIYLMLATRTYIDVSIYLQLIPLLLPQIIIGKILMMFLEFAFHGKDVRTFEKLSSSEETLTLFHMLLMSSVDALLYFTLGAYLENILPGKYGMSLPFKYPFLRSYWRRGTLETEELIIGEENSNENFEPIPGNLKPGLSVRNLYKIYRSKIEGDLMALNNVSLDFYEGEMCGLLGHNGAGKTTLISILCGMTCPTSGTVNIKGTDVTFKRSYDAQKIGYCPQHEMFIDLLTVRANLIFFGLAKGMSLNKAIKNSRGLIGKIKLDAERTLEAKKLSGAQQRKLSLAIALMGNPEILILDEPTSGIDVLARRQIWDALLEIRSRKTVILCTHYMEEADALCDRIVVMSNGQIESYGTPIFLKSRFGMGYALSVVAADLNKTSYITNLVKAATKTAQFKHQNKLTIVYQISDKEMDNFPKLFDLLDSRKKSGEIISYTLTVTTMEDVFINISTSVSKKEKIFLPEEPGERIVKLDHFTLCWFQMITLLSKKLKYMRRKWILYLFLYVIFIALHIITAYSSTLVSNEKSMESLEYRLGIYKGAKVLYHSKNPKNHLNDTLFEKEVVKSGGKFQKVDDVSEALKDDFYKNYHDYSKIIIGIENAGDNVTIFFNDEAIHAVQIALNMLHNVFLKSMAEKGSIKTSISLKNRIRRQDSGGVFSAHNKCPSLAFTFPLITYAVEVIIFLIHPLDEQHSNMKTSQLMLVPSVTYWSSYFFIDLPFIFSYGLLTAIIHVSANYSPVMSNFIEQHSGRLILNLFIHSIDSLLMVYISSCLYKNFITALIFMLVIRGVGVLFVYAPIEGLKYAVYLSSSAIWSLDNHTLCGTDGYNGTFELLLIHTAFLMIILLLLESGILKMIYHKMFTRLCRVKFVWEHPKDRLVEIEEETVDKLIENRQLSTKILTINQLKRWYCHCCNCKHRGDCNCVNPAVKGVSFAVDKGECFGLVGINGAGKSTIFNILAGGLTPSRGSAYLKSTSLFNICLRHNTLYKMGYCPQFGNFFPDFKGREMLEFFARLRGLKRSSRRREVEKWIKHMKLEAFEKRKCGSYSGGNQRKLSTAIALIGNPVLTLLDEPTTGVDPFGRRSIWDAISRFREKGQSILLTSHSMEECDALCTRLAIMSKGEIRCIGETTTLKNLIGDTSTVLIKTAFTATEENRLRLKKEVVDKFGPGCQLIDDHLTVMEYQVLMESNTWKKLFTELNSMKRKYQFLEFFSITSTSLEQIFIATTKDDQF